METLDPYYRALVFYQKRRLEECGNLCMKMLQKDPKNHQAFALRLLCLNEQVRAEADEREPTGIAEDLMDNTTMATAARPGTSFKTGTPKTMRPGSGVRPGSKSGGVTRPGSNQGDRPKTVKQAIKTARSRSGIGTSAARPLTGAVGGRGSTGRLLTASVLADSEAVLDSILMQYQKYKTSHALSKLMFEYYCYYKNDVRQALQLAMAVHDSGQSASWYWSAAVGKCQYLLGMFRDAEKHMRVALSEPIVDTFLDLGRVFVQLDQPLSSIDVYRKGLERFPNDVSLIIQLARVYEDTGQTENALKTYKQVLPHDATNAEAIACIGTNYYYADQEEIGLRYYRRLLQMGFVSFEVLMNIGLCCLAAQHLDIALGCFERAFEMPGAASNPDYWFNVGSVGLTVGDSNLAYQALRLALVCGNVDTETFENLAALEERNGDKGKMWKRLKQLVLKNQQ